MGSLRAEEQSSKNTIKLADAETMRAQLESIDTGVTLEKHYFQVLLHELADSEKTPQEIANIFQIAGMTFGFFDGSLRLDFGRVNFAHRSMYLRSARPKFVQAILPNNPDEAKTVLELLNH